MKKQPRSLVMLGFYLLILCTIPLPFTVFAAAQDSEIPGVPIATPRTAARARRGLSRRRRGRIRCRRCGRGGRRTTVVRGFGVFSEQPPVFLGQAVVVTG